MTKSDGKSWTLGWYLYFRVFRIVIFNNYTFTGFRKDYLEIGRMDYLKAERKDYLETGKEGLPRNRESERSPGDE